MQIEYIRREDMLNAVEKLDIIPSVDGMGNPTNAEDFRVQFLGTVLKVEPADVAPVVHGHWEYIDDTYCGFKDTDVRCSVCKTTTNIKRFRKTKWCPDCGAKMDEEERACHTVKQY